MKKIGITGGIGSGKSFVMQHLEKLGFPVYYSDKEAKKILQTPEIIEKIETTFNQKITDNHGIVNRKELAEIVFNNPEKLQQLNDIIHPAVRLDFQNFTEKNQNKKVVFFESALLIETGSYKNMDAVWLITAPEALRIERVMQRDGITAHQVKARMKQQLSENEKKQYADAIIENIDAENTLKSVEKLLENLKLY